MKKNTISNFFGTCYKQQAQNANFTKLSNLFGLKVTANKVAFTAIDKNVTSWQKVEVLANSTALNTLYMGGSTNIEGVIINMATSYVGSNNFPILDTKGDFGGRLNKAAAASRYIFTKKHENFDKIFNKIDFNILPRYNFEGEDIEYQFLSFNVPLILLNGANGMGSGHSQNILNRKLEDCIKYIKCSLTSKKLPDIPVYYNGFKGTIEQGENDKQWIIKGAIERINKNTTKIIEVPIQESYKSMKKTLDKLVESKIINSYNDLCDPKTDTFLFEIKHSKEFSELSDDEILNKLKLTQKVSENYTIIDENNAVKVFDSAKDLFDHYIKVRLYYYNLRKEFLIKKYNEDISILEAKRKFIELVITNKIIISKRSKEDISKQIESFNIIKVDDSYDYLLRLPLYSLTIEKIAELSSEISKAESILEVTKNKTVQEMWLEELDKISKGSK